MNHIFYNNSTDRNLSQEIIRQIHDAGIWIKACNLLFDDEDIRNELLAALSRGVAVFILTNLEGVTGEVYTDNSSGKKIHARQTTLNIFHSASLKKLYNAGAHISGLDGLHAKFMITDNSEGVITSLNFTPNSVSKISELGIQISDKEFDETEEVFDHLFLRPDKFRFASYDSHFSYERPTDAIDCEELSRISNIKLTLAPTNRGKGNALAQCNIMDLRDEIFDIINSTKTGEDLYIATYSLEPNATGPDNETLAHALLNAKKRDVRLHIVMRDEKRKVIEGVLIHYHKDNHAKVVMNGKRGILFTGNLTTESFENGFDLGVLLNEKQICETRNFINHLIRQTER